MLVHYAIRQQDDWNQNRSGLMWKVVAVVNRSGRECAICSTSEHSQAEIIVEALTERLIKKEENAVRELRKRQENAA